MAELRVDEFGMNFHPTYFSHPVDGVHMCYLTKISFYKGMKCRRWFKSKDFQPSNIWISIKFFNNFWDNIPCLKGVITGCVFQPEIKWKLSLIWSGGNAPPGPSSLVLMHLVVLCWWCCCPCHWCWCPLHSHPLTLVSGPYLLLLLLGGGGSTWGWSCWCKIDVIKIKMYKNKIKGGGLTSILACFPCISCIGCGCHHQWWKVVVVICHPLSSCIPVPCFIVSC